MKKSRWLRICSLSLAVFLTACLCVVPAAAALREGDRGNEVRKVQEKLKQWGYYTGEADGIFGPKTAEAVRSFQRKNGLTVDGIVGMQPYRALGITPQGSSSGSS